VVWERQIGQRLAQRPSTTFLQKFVSFGVKQAWACLFGRTVIYYRIVSYALVL